MKRFFWLSLIIILFFALALIVCYIIYGRLQQDYVATVSHNIAYDARIHLENSGMGIYYQGKGEDSIHYGLVYEMDNATWHEMKASGRDMRIRDAIVIRNTFAPVTIEGISHPQLPPYCRVDTQKDSLYAATVHYDLDFTEQPGGYLRITYRGNIFGTVEKNISVNLSYRCRDSQMGYGDDPNILFINVPPEIDIETIPEYTARNPQQVEFEKADLVHFQADGIHIKGNIPRNTQRYEVWIFFLAAGLGALMSLLITILYDVIKMRMGTKRAARQREKSILLPIGDQSGADDPENAVLTVTPNSEPVVDDSADISIEEKSPIS